MFNNHSHHALFANSSLSPWTGPAQPFTHRQSFFTPPASLSARVAAARPVTSQDIFQLFSELKTALDSVFGQFQAFAGNPVSAAPSSKNFASISIDDDHVGSARGDGRPSSNSKNPWAKEDEDRGGIAGFKE